MSEPREPGPEASASTGRLALQGLLALLMLVPVTLPVPVLRTLVHERFGVSELWTSVFMSINMVGAVVAAPLVGMLADRVGHRARIAVVALVLDALCFGLLTLDVPFALFLTVRFFEGCAHIAALSVLLSLASTSVPEARRGRAMGLVGLGLLLGVALGAPLGGVLGREDPLQPLRLGVVVIGAAAVLAALVLRERPGELPMRRSARPRAALRHARGIALPLLFAFADRFTVGFYTTTFSLFLSRVHAMDPAAIGLSISAFMLPFALLSYPFGWLSERSSRVGMLCIGSVLYGIGTALITLWSPQLLPFAMAATGVAAAVMFVPTMLLTTELAPDSLRSTALGAFNAAGSLGFIAGPLVGGFVSERVAASWGWEAGYRAAFQVAGGSEILLVLLALPFLRRAEARTRARVG